MRTLLILAFLVVLMVIGGWLAFSYTGGAARVEFRTDAVKRDVDKVIEGTEKFIQDIGEKTAPSNRLLTFPRLQSPSPVSASRIYHPLDGDMRFARPYS